MECSPDYFQKCEHCGCENHIDYMHNINSPEYQGHDGKDVAEPYYLCDNCETNFELQDDDTVDDDYKIFTCPDCGVREEADRLFYDSYGDPVCIVCARYIPEGC